MITLIAGQRACILDRLAQAADEAINDQVECALEYVIDTLTEACQHVTTVVFTDSDNHVSLWIDALTCATHLQDDCPAGHLIYRDPYATFAYHLRSDAVDWLCETYGLIDGHHLGEPEYTLDVATWRARHAEHSMED